METTNIKHIAYLADACAKQGIDHIVISPGSRNAPIVLAVEAHPDIQTYLIHDERSAAFFALGLAEAMDQPVALTCTSGSALLNYAPALVEAYYRQIPLLVLSADRPEELIDQGDGQTMRQQEVYRNYIKRSYNLPNHDHPELEKKARQLIHDTLETLFQQPSGPVHLNIPLAEPLYETVPRSSFEIEPRVEKTKDAFHLEDEFKEIWRTTEKKLILVGQHEPNQQMESLLKQLSGNPSVAVLVENTSNMQDFTSFCHCIDRTLAAIGEEEKDEFAPELLITLGGAVISKRIKKYFRTYRSKHNWRVGQFLIQADTYQSLTKTFSIDATAFLQELAQLDAPALSNFGGKWKQKDFLAEEQHQLFISQAPYADLTVFDTILDYIPDHANLHMGNSSVVRYCQLFDPVRGMKYYSNRGVSGIDGSSSTAVGFACADPEKLNVLISGDISFFYDSNAFWNKQLRGNLKVIVISNGGGGIFQIIPGPPASEIADRFFAPTSPSVKGVCDTYDLKYYRADSLEDISKSVESFFQKEKNNRPSVLEINTSKSDNAKVLADYFDQISQLAK